MTQSAAPARAPAARASRRGPRAAARAAAAAKEAATAPSAAPAAEQARCARVRSSRAPTHLPQPLTKEVGLALFRDMYLGRAFEDMCAQARGEAAERGRRGWRSSELFY